MWKLGRVENLIISNDGKVRTADIYLPGNRHVQRSINMLYPLELYDGQIDKLNETEKSKGDDVRSQDAGHIKKNDSLKVPIRHAAFAARHKINELLENDALNMLFAAV